MGFEIQINGEKIADSGDSSERLVTEISIMTPRGEAARIRIPPEERVLNLVIEPRSLENRPLDLMDELKVRDLDGKVDALVEEFGGVRDVDLPAAEKNDLRQPSAREQEAAAERERQGKGNGPEIFNGRPGMPDHTPAESEEDDEGERATFEESFS